VQARVGTSVSVEDAASRKARLRPAGYRDACRDHDNEPTSSDG
jgi:hypothetical protein